MKFLVRVRLEGVEAPKLEWPEQEVDAVDKWDALVKAVEGLGIVQLVPMSAFWGKSSIIKKDRSEIRRWRKRG